MTSLATEPDSLSAYGEARSTIEGAPLDPDELRLMDAYWRASMYLCLGMIYLKDNPLLREPLALDHLKTRLLGHWGSDPGQSFVYIHLNRLIRKYDLDAIFLSGPGHGLSSAERCYWSHERIEVSCWPTSPYRGA